MTPDQLIDDLVFLHYGQADARTKHLFRQSLLVLMELAKREERLEANGVLADESLRNAHRRTMH